MCLACTLPTPSPFVPAAVGRCPGALADALLQLAEGVRGARLALLKDLRTRLLTLFADFALILPSPAYVRDLGALLPALGAVGEAVAEATAGRMSASLSAADLSLDALNTAQEEDLLVLRLFRWGPAALHRTQATAGRGGDAAQRGLAVRRRSNCLWAAHPSAGSSGSTAECTTLRGSSGPRRPSTAARPRRRCAGLRHGGLLWAASRRSARF
jgi:hypothetical protein